ncbi:MAG: hypothetical protein PWP65_1641 [Clostridia bacterium]|nr:hypothetical protein [Clostridia bacterium]
MGARSYKIALWLVIIAAIIGSVYLAGKRYNLEMANRELTMAVDYQEVQKLAAWSNRTPASVLALLKERGVTAVLFKEQTLGDLEGWALLVKGGNEAAVMLPQVGGELRPQYTYLLTRDISVYEQIKYQLALKLPGPLQELRANDYFILGLPQKKKELANLGLGFNRKQMEEVISSGLGVIPQVRSWPQAQEAAVKEFLYPLAPYREHIVALLFNDKILPGYPRHFPVLVQAVKDLGVPVGLIEFFPQAGLRQLALLLGKQAIRLHSIAEKDMSAMTPAKALDRFNLSATDRNMRILFLRFFFEPTSPGWLQDNLDFVEKLKQNLSASGFVLGRARPFPSFPVPVWLIMLSGLGVLAGGMLLLEEAGYRRCSLLFGLGGIFIWPLSFVLGYGTLARQGMALGAAVVFPVLGVLQAARRGPQRTLPAIWLLAGATLITLLGATLLVGLLSGTSFMLKLDEFRGVKIAFALPLLLFTLIMLKERGGEQAGALIRRWLHYPLTVAGLLAVGVLAAGALIYFTRSGNQGFGVTGIELTVRNFLEQALLARPRTKEFLIGYPFLLLSITLGYQHRYLIFWLLGLIGQISLINTFSHIHTPLAISLLRSFNGFWLGLLLGLLLLAAARWAGGITRGQSGY